jgi:hypothetical protein
VALGGWATQEERAKQKKIFERDVAEIYDFQSAPRVSDSSILFSFASMIN